MEYRKLGRTKLQVSAIGLGCVTFGREIDEKASFAVLDHALECGVNLIDTAEAYAKGRSEETLGAWLASRKTRERIVLATKVTPPLNRKRILRSAEDSLRRLRTDHVDLFQLHAWDPNTRLNETLGALDTLVKDGKARHVGCSNFTALQLCKALWKQEVMGTARMVSVQPIYNLVHRQIESEMLPLSAEEGVGVITYSPLGAGFLSGKYRKGRPVPKGTRFEIIPGHQDVYFTDHGFEVLKRLRACSRAAKIPVIRLALAWALRQPGPTSVLIGARSPLHIDQALAANALRLGRAAIRALGGL